VTQADLDVDLSSEPLIFPLGHYIGAYHPEDGAPLAYHTIRIGRQPVRLGSDQELVLWGLAHGDPEDVKRPWTRQDVLKLADDAEIPDADELLQELINDDIIVEVRPGTNDAIDFAEAYRVVPMLFGLGPGGTNGSLHRLGLGTQTSIEVDDLTFELWRLGHLTDDLWTFCDLYGEALRRAGGRAEADTAPESLLTQVLWDIQPLLGAQAAYLDTSPALWS
jgi:hypothetical protein